MTAAVGFVGLGDMGSVLAGNLVATGHIVTTHDIAGPGRNPDGARFVDDIATLAQTSDTVVLSLPDGAVSEVVVAEIIATTDRTVRLVVDTSTVGLEASPCDARVAIGGDAARSRPRRSPDPARAAARPSEGGAGRDAGAHFELRPRQSRTGRAQPGAAHAHGGAPGPDRPAGRRRKHPLDQRLPLPIEEVLYRISQEALHNVVKHAGARQVRLELGRIASGVRLRVTDDGKGFDPGRVPDGHLGLAGMRARADKIRARFSVKSVPGEGTTIEVVVPNAVIEAGGATPAAPEAASIRDG